MWGVFALFIHWCGRSLWNAVGVWSVYTQHNIGGAAAASLRLQLAAGWLALLLKRENVSLVSMQPPLTLHLALSSSSSHACRDFLLTPWWPRPFHVQQPAHPSLPLQRFFASFPLIGLCFKSYTPRPVSCLMCSVSYCERQRLVCLHRVWRLNNLSARPTHCSVSKLRSQCL